ncbi:MAG: hypothetical protein HC847_18965, partial [Hydrococcus sp. RU_2_2]|nr:hypothetical protein [Hydrococcus sp. RU_2_2]
MVEETELAIALGIRNAPTVVLFQQQQEQARIAGLKPKNNIWIWYSSSSEYCFQQSNTL